MIEKVLFGKIGLALSEVENMRISQVLNAINGYYEKEADIVKSLRRLIWGPVRWATWRLVNISGRILKPEISCPEKMIPFEWDKIEKPKKDEVEILIKAFPDKWP
jgi:hypothetical protein